jgi:hypothetical protein
VSTAVSIPAAWLVGGLAQALGLPLLGVARRAQAAGDARREGAGEPGEPSTAGEPGPRREPTPELLTVAAGPTLGCVCDTGFEPCCAPAGGDDRERAA